MKTRISYQINKETQSHISGVNTLCLADDILYSGGRDSIVLSSQQGLVYKHSHWVNDLIVKQDMVISCSSDRSVLVNGTLLATHKDHVKCLADFNSDSILSAGLDKHVFLNNITSQTQHPIHTSTKSIYSIATHCNSVVTGGPQGVVKVFDSREQQTMYSDLSLFGHLDTVKAILMDDDFTVITGKCWSLIECFRFILFAEKIAIRRFCLISSSLPQITKRRAKNTNRRLIR